MIGLDTNIIVRYIVQGDPDQCRKVNDLMENRLSAREPGFITLVALIEVIWVLESSYCQAKSVILKVLRSLLATRQLMIERADIIHKVSSLFEAAHADFSDAVTYLLTQDSGCSDCFTFDKKARRMGIKSL
ncbi:MAG: PIN domain-containing protein [Endozoicomonas sp.]